MAALSENDVDINTVCSKPCIKYYKRDNAPDTLRECPKGLLSNVPCFVPGNQDHAVYSLFGIRWNDYVRPILENFFVRGLNDRHHIFRQMIRLLFPTSNGDINPNFTNTDDFKKCKDAICGYRIHIKYGYYDLFHISLHSMKPRYIQGKTPRIFGCAAYPLAQLSQGAFHYKIDANSSLHPIDPAPFKELHAQINGTFSPSIIPFAISKSNENEQNYAIFHEYIYRRFINYWNRCVDYVNQKQNLNGPDTPWSNPKKHMSDERDNLSSIKEDIQKAIRVATPLRNSASKQEVLSFNLFTQEIIGLIQTKQSAASASAASASAASPAASAHPKQPSAAAAHPKQPSAAAAASAHPKQPLAAAPVSKKPSLLFMKALEKSLGKEAEQISFNVNSLNNKTRKARSRSRSPNKTRSRSRSSNRSKSRSTSRSRSRSRSKSKSHSKKGKKAKRRSRKR
jgi:hypothetical protein